MQMNKKLKKPDLILSMDDKVYLALAFKQVNGMGFIFMLVCAKVGEATYSLMPQTQIMTFKNVADAKIYYHTLQQIQDFQDKNEGFKRLKEVNKICVQKFLLSNNATNSL